LYAYLRSFMGDRNIPPSFNTPKNIK
jgi:hypothetical protein